MVLKDKKYIFHQARPMKAIAIPMTPATNDLIWTPIEQYPVTKKPVGYTIVAEVVLGSNGKVFELTMLV